MRHPNFVTLPTVIDAPGQYRTRSGGIVTVTSVHKSVAEGHYSDNINETWDVSGRLLASLTSNDIVAKA